MRRAGIITPGRAAPRAALLALLLIAALATFALPASADPTADIVGGTVVPPDSHDWDFITQVIVTDGTTDYFACGGSLIRRDWVLTAAHCTDAGLPISYVVTGAKDFDGGFATPVDRVIPHPAFNSATGENDIALLHLGRPAFTGAPLKRLATAASDPATDDTVRVAGWGDTFFGSGAPSPSLLEADVEVVANSSCDSTYQGLAEPQTIFDSMLCAAHFDGSNSRDACQGDSGGPLVQDQTEGATLVGVVQGGEGCAQSPYPGIYTRVSSYRSWIYSYLDTTLSATTVPLGPWTDLPPGIAATFNVNVSNTGPNEVEFSKAKVTGAGFSLEHDLCTSGDPHLAPGASCHLGITFAPTAVGVYNGVLTIPTDSAAKPEITVPFSLTSAPPAKLGLLFARGFGGFTKTLGRITRLSRKGKPVALIALEAKIPPSDNPEMSWRRCSGSGVIRARFPGHTKSSSAATGLSQYGNGHCFAIAYVRVPKDGIGKRVRVSAEFFGTGYILPAKFTGKLRLAKQVK